MIVPLAMFSVGSLLHFTEYYTRTIWPSFCVAFHLLITLPLRALATIALLYYLVYGSLIVQTLLIAYISYIYYFDKDTPYLGGRKWRWFCHSIYFKGIADYFPVRLVVKGKLDKTRNYLAISHPHGVWFFTQTLTWAADYFRLEENYGLRTSQSTLNSNFRFPLAREYLLAQGMISVDEVSLKYVLNGGKGNLIGLVPGGAVEAGMNCDHHYRVFLKKRKGFCRIALETGTSLIPTFSFGENDYFKVVVVPYISAIQNFVLNWTGVNFVIFKNTKTNRYILAMPEKVPLTVVLGEPINVEKNTSPTKEDITELHNKYMAALQKLFEDEKHNYLNNAENIELFIE